MNLSPAYYQWEEETLNKGIQMGKQEGIQMGKQAARIEDAIRLVNAGIPLSQVAQILELDPSLIHQALESGSSE